MRLKIWTIIILNVLFILFLANNPKQIIEAEMPISWYAHKTKTNYSIYI